MEGKTITKVLELESGYQALLLDNEEVAIVKVVTPDLSLDEVREFVGAETPKTSVKEKPAEKEPVKEKPAAKKDPEPDPDDEEEEEGYNWADLLAMDYAGLKELCDDNDLGTDPKDYDEEEVEEFRKEIAEEIGVEVPDDEDEEEPTQTAGEPEPDEDDTYTWEDLKAMDIDELTDLVDENSLDIDPNEYDDDSEDKFRRAIASLIGVEPPKVKPRKK